MLRSVLDQLVSAIRYNVALIGAESPAMTETQRKLITAIPGQHKVIDLIRDILQNQNHPEGTRA